MYYGMKFIKILEPFYKYSNNGYPWIPNLVPQLLKNVMVTPFFIVKKYFKALSSHPNFYNFF